MLSSLGPHFVFEELGQVFVVPCPAVYFGQNLKAIFQVLTLCVAAPGQMSLLSLSPFAPNVALCLSKHRLSSSSTGLCYSKATIAEPRVEAILKFDLRFLGPFVQHIIVPLFVASAHHSLSDIY